MPGVSVVADAPRRGTLWSGTTRVHVRPLAHDPFGAFLILTGSHGDAFSPPEEPVLQQWLETLVEWGYRRVRTNAVASATDTALQGVGFSVVQDLVLLSVTHWSPPHMSPPCAWVPKRALRWGALRTSTRRDILALDAAAFGPQWSLDRESLTDAIGATSRSQVFVCRRKSVLDGFVVVGSSGGTGYVQRLAVNDTQRQHGVGSCLVGAALRWTHARGCTHTVVNTETTNSAAQALYEKMGFVALPNRLTVLYKELQ